MDCEIKKSSDGFYHPETEEQIICLVKKAYEEGLQIRVQRSYAFNSSCYLHRSGKG